MKTTLRVVNLFFILGCGSLIVLNIIKISRDGSALTTVALFGNAFVVALHAAQLIRSFETKQ